MLLATCSLVITLRTLPLMKFHQLYDYNVQISNKIQPITYTHDNDIIMIIILI